MTTRQPAPNDPTAPAGTPTGDAAATGRLTGHPTALPGAAPGQPGAGAAEPAAPARAQPAGAATAPVDSGPGVVKRTTSNLKRVLLVVIGALLALFAVFNSQQVEVHWIFGDAIRTPLIIVIAITFAAGAAIGWLVAKLGRRAGNTGGTGPSA